MAGWSSGRTFFVDSQRAAVEPLGLKDRRLYFFPGDAPPASLVPLIGNSINANRIRANRNDILRLVTTIRSGQVRPSTLRA